MFCRNCGKGLQSSFAFCPNCGTKVEAETSLYSRDNIVGSASLMSQASRKRPLSPLESRPAAPAAKQLPTLRQFLDRKSEEQRGQFTGFDPAPSISFVHDESKIVPYAQTCSNVLYLYVNETSINSPIHRFIFAALMNGGLKYYFFINVIYPNTFIIALG